VENVFWRDYNYVKKYLWIYNCQEVLYGTGIIILKDIRNENEQYQNFGRQN